MRLSLDALKSALASYVASANIDLDTLAVTTDNIVGLVDTIGKIYTIEHNVYDKLEELDGEYLSYGKTVEEWAQDMQLPSNWDNDANGDKALKDYTPTYRPVMFSTTLGRKIFATSIPYGNIERAVHNEAQYINVVTEITKKLEDSVALFKYGAKRQLLGELATRALATCDGSTPTLYVASTTILQAGAFYRDGGSPEKFAVSMITNAAAVASTFAQLVAAGDLILLDLVEKIAIPTDTSSAEAFIKSVKNAVEKANDVSEGHSFNGAVLGVEQGLKLYVKQGVMSSVEVDAMAGAFQAEKIALPVEVKVIKDFGNADSDVFAILVDPRGVKLFEGYNATRSNENGYGDRLNIFRHKEFTAHISRNIFVRVFVKP